MKDNLQLTLKTDIEKKILLLTGFEAQLIGYLLTLKHTHYNDLELMLNEDIREIQKVIAKYKAIGL